FSLLIVDGSFNKPTVSYSLCRITSKISTFTVMTAISQNPTLLEQWRATLKDEVLKSPCTPIPIPEETLIERVLRCLRDHAEKFPKKKAAIEAENQDRSLTYQEIHARALSFAAFLTSRGFAVGDRLTAALSNSIEQVLSNSSRKRCFYSNKQFMSLRWPVLHLGTWAAGGAVVGSSPAFKLYETTYQLRDSSSTVIVVAEEQLGMLMEAAKECPSVKAIICVRSTINPLPEGVIDFEETLRHEPLEELAPVTLDTPCMVY
ncbi:hypothetical protein PMAYCL1PPCAC_27054, partial [Pristionchus mayeri]